MYWVSSLYPNNTFIKVAYNKTCNLNRYDGECTYCAESGYNYKGAKEHCNEAAVNKSKNSTSPEVIHLAL